MKTLFFSIFFILICGFSFANQIFQTDEYQLNFSSNNINLTKEQKINLIKIKSFNKIIKRILTINDFKKIETSEIEFVDQFVLNYTINEEKIIKNNYFSKIKVNFNENLLFNYLIKNKFKFVNFLPNKFLLIINEKNNLNKYLLSEKNSFYSYLINNKKMSLKNNFLIPNLDYNDRFIFNDYHFKNNIFERNNLLNTKYNTSYQILINVTQKNNSYNVESHLYFKNSKFLIFNNVYNKLNYEIIFNEILSNATDKWKELNYIDTSIIENIKCVIKTNNYNELNYIKNILSFNRIIKNYNLELIKLNQNLYSIFYFGKLEVLQNSLEIERVKLIINNNKCNLKLS